MNSPSTYRTLLETIERVLDAATELVPENDSDEDSFEYGVRRFVISLTQTYFMCVGTEKDFLQVAKKRYQETFNALWVAGLGNSKLTGYIFIRYAELVGGEIRLPDLNGVYKSLYEGYVNGDKNETDSEPGDIVDAHEFDNFKNGSVDSGDDVHDFKDSDNDSTSEDVQSKAKR